MASQALDSLRQRPRLRSDSRHPTRLPSAVAYVVRYLTIQFDLRSVAQPTKESPDGAKESADHACPEHKERVNSDSHNPAVTHAIHGSSRCAAADDTEEKEQERARRHCQDDGGSESVSRRSEHKLAARAGSRAMGMKVSEANDGCDDVRRREKKARDEVQAFQRRIGVRQPAVYPAGIIEVRVDESQPNDRNRKEGPADERSGADPSRRTRVGIHVIRTISPSRSIT